MKSNTILYSVYDVVEDKEILTRVSGNEAAEALDTTNKYIYLYSQNGSNLRNRYYIFRHDDKNADFKKYWRKNFKLEWELICNFLNPGRKVAKNGK